MKALAIIVTMLLLLAIGAIVVLIGALIDEHEKKKPAPEKPLPQGWHIVYQKTNNNIPESILMLNSNRVVYRFAIDFRTNLVDKTKAYRD